MALRIRRKAEKRRSSALSFMEAEGGEEGRVGGVFRSFFSLQLDLWIRQRTLIYLCGDRIRLYHKT